MKPIKISEPVSKKRGLGLGLSQLLSDIKTIKDKDNDKLLLQHLPISLLKPGKYQPRRNINKDELADLANSIRTQGIIQPIIVRPMMNGDYEIIAGERRWRAAQLAKLQEVPVVVREIPDEQVIALSLIENIQREDLNAIDTAVGLQRLINEFNMTHESAAIAVGKSRTAVTNLLRLLDLSEEIQKLVQHKQVEMGHARALLSLDPPKQLVVANAIISKNLSVRATEVLVRQLQEPRITTKTTIDPNIERFQEQIADKLAASVKIYPAKKGKGKMIIKYDNLDNILKYFN